MKQRRENGCQTEFSEAGTTVKYCSSSLFSCACSITEVITAAVTNAKDCFTARNKKAATTLKSGSARTAFFIRFH